MLHLGWLPFFAVLGDHLVVDGDLGVENLDLRAIERERGVKEGQVLEGLFIDVEDELAHLTNILTKVDFGFNAADIVREDDWKHSIDVAEGFASAVEVGLVESEVDGLTLGQVLGHKRVLHPSHEEIEVVGPDQTSSKL